MFNRLLQVLLLVISVSTVSIAQKRSLKVDDFKDWNRIRETQLSDDGQWFLYQISPNHGDNTLVLNSVDKKIEHRFERGEKSDFFPSSKAIVFIQKAPLDSIRAKKVDGKKAPKSSVGIYSIEKDVKLLVEKVSSYQMSKEKNDFLAFISDVKLDEAKDTTKVEKKKDKKATLKNLYIVNGRTLDTMLIRKVTKFTLSKDGSAVAYVQQKDDSLKHASLWYMNLLNRSSYKVQEGDHATYETISLDNKGAQLAYLFSTDTTKVKSYQAYYYKSEKNVHRCFAKAGEKSLHAKMVPSKHKSMVFSEDGSRLFFGVQYPELEAPKDSLMDNEKAKLDLWSWNDKDIQPRQLVNLSKDKKRAFRALYQISMNNIIALNDSSCMGFDIPEKGMGAYALAQDNLPYKKSYSWTALWGGDYYAFNLKNGEKQLVAKNVEQVELSPNGQYAVYYQWNDSTYYAKDLKRGKMYALTAGLKVPFYNVHHDTPSSPAPYGIMGWGKDQSVYIYDEYDVWKIDLCHKVAPKRITKGREKNWKYRYDALDREEDYIASKPLFYLTNKETMATAYAYLDLATGVETRHLEGDYQLGWPVKAKNAAVVKWSKQTYRMFPDYHTSNLSFDAPQRQTDINPQQKDFKWGHIQMVKWVSFNGDSLKGLLVTPEKMEKGKKYPMMCYFYETYSERLHQYWLPAPSRSTINKSLYPSNDYVLFIPDIYYRDGYPGQSAYDAIVSGAYAMCERYDFIDRYHMALQGQSWGGYQTAYLVTQTNMFAAAMAGAPVSNMTSAYGGIRWGSGLSREFQYEQTQSRIGGTLWDKPMQYIENSPVFYAPKVRTPLLIMHNDEDGAVPWYQGIEYFMALRRLNKPVWMLQYNGQPHNLSADAWGDRIDLSRRMLQFFDHYLKGAPAPRWMKEGVKAIDKGQDLGY